MKNFYINTTTFKNTVQSIQVFKSDKFSKHISPAMITQIILQAYDKDVFELPQAMVKFVKIEDNKLGDKKTEIAKDSDDKNIGFIIGHNPKERIDLTKLLREKKINLDTIKKIKVVYDEVQIDAISLNTSMASNQSNLTDVSLMEKLADIDDGNNKILDELNTEIKEVKTEKADTETQLNNIKKDYADLQVQHQVTQKEKSELQAIITKQEDQLKSLNTELSRLTEIESKSKEQLSKIEQLNDEKSKLLVEIDDNKKIANELILKQTATEKEIDELKSEHNKIILNKDTEIQTVRNQEAEKDQALKTATKQYADLQVQHQVTQKERDSIREQLDQKATEIASMAQLLSTANQNLADKQVEYDRINEQFKTANDNYKKAQADSHSFKQQYTDAGAERDRLRGRLNELEVEIVGLRNQITSLNFQVDNISKQGDFVKNDLENKIKIYIKYIRDLDKLGNKFYNGLQQYGAMFIMQHEYKNNLKTFWPVRMNYEHQIIKDLY